MKSSSRKCVEINPVKPDIFNNSPKKYNYNNGLLEKVGKKRIICVSFQIDVFLLTFIRLLWFIYYNRDFGVDAK